MTSLPESKQPKVISGLMAGVKAVIKIAIYSIGSTRPVPGILITGHYDNTDKDFTCYCFTYKIIKFYITCMFYLLF